MPLGIVMLSKIHLKDWLANYVNPISRLGIRTYSFFFPFFTTSLICLISEFFAYRVVNDPDSVGIYIIFITIALILYFSFRDGIRGGLVTTSTTIVYYFYIIWSRNHTGEQLITSIETTIFLALLYVLLATIIGWLKQTIDVLVEKETTARQEAEEGQLQLQSILQQLPVGVLLVDAKTGRMNGNKQMEKILGRRTPIQLQKGEQYKSLYAFRDKKTLLSKEWPIVRALKTGEVITAEEIEFVRNDKKRIFLRVNAAPIKNKNQKIVAAVSTLYDITQEKELEQRKDDFVNMASHELKTPITSMKLYVELLLKWVEKFKDERTTKTLTNVKIQTERLQELVNDLLDMSRIQTGKLFFKKESFELNSFIQEMVDVLQSTTKQQRIVFSSKNEILVYADKFRIYQVLTNLITNASKYSPEKTEIIIKVKKKGSRVVVSVQDFGIGIEKEQRRKIFDRLYQVTDSKEKTFPGLGMGLYISKEIITRHRGSIWVDGVKGKGSTFSFSLPLKNK